MTEKNLSSAPEASAKLPFLQFLIGPYALLVDNFKHFFIVGSVFAVLLMFLYIAGGQTALCVNEEYRAAHYCSGRLDVFIVVHLLSLFLICLFVRNWYRIVFLQERLNWRKLFKFEWADLKIIGCFLAFALSVAAALLSAYLLYVRIPNPNWKIELGFFTIVSAGFFIPLIALRFFCCFAFVAEGKPLPKLSLIWHKTSGNGFAILSGMLILLIFATFLSQSMFRTFAMTSLDDRLFVMLGSEYLSDMTLLFIVACFMNYCYLQKKFLFERN